MKRAIILHGTQGSPDGNWFRWLQQELIDRRIDVWLPELPHAEQPSLNEWVQFVQNSCPFKLDNQTLVIGHSSGAILALILAQKSAVPIGAIVCVSVFHDNSLAWEANDRLFDVPFDFPAAGRNAQLQLVVHSDDDPYVPLEQAKYVADSAGAEFVVVPGQGHFNLEKGPSYREFPKLIELLEERNVV